MQYEVVAINWKVCNTGKQGPQWRGLHYKSEYLAGMRGVTEMIDSTSHCGCLITYPVQFCA